MFDAKKVAAMAMSLSPDKRSEYQADLFEISESITKIDTAVKDKNDSFSLSIRLRLSQTLEIMISAGMGPHILKIARRVLFELSQEVMAAKRGAYK